MVNIGSGLFINTATVADRTVAADSRRALTQLLACSAAGVPLQGVLPNATTDPLRVTSGSTSALLFNIAAGYAVVARSTALTLGGYLVGTTSQVQLTLAAANASNPRIDVVYICQPDPEVGDNTHARIDVITGTAAASPTAPTASLPQGGMLLAQILVPAGATAASACTITDLRSASATDGRVYAGSTAGLPSVAQDGSRAQVGAIEYRFIAGTGWRPWDSWWMNFTYGAVNLAFGTVALNRYRYRGGRVLVEQYLYGTVNVNSGSPNGIITHGLPVTADGSGGQIFSRTRAVDSGNAEFPLDVNLTDVNTIKFQFWTGSPARAQDMTVSNLMTWNTGDLLIVTYEYDPA